MSYVSFSVDFTLIPGKVLPYSSDAVYQRISSPTECANICLSQTKSPCNSFDYCVSSQTCFLSVRHVQDGTILNTKYKL